MSDSEKNLGKKWAKEPASQTSNPKKGKPMEKNCPERFPLVSLSLSSSQGLLTFHHKSIILSTIILILINYVPQSHLNYYQMSIL